MKPKAKPMKCFTVGKWSAPLCVEWFLHRRGITVPSPGHPLTALFERVTCASCLVVMDELEELGQPVATRRHVVRIQKNGGERMWPQRYTLDDVRQRQPQYRHRSVQVLDPHSLRYHADRLRKENES